MSQDNGRWLWLKLFGAFAVPFALWLVGYGALTEQVRDVRTEVDRRAPQAVVDAQYQEILRRLDRIERQLDKP